MLLCVYRPLEIRRFRDSRNECTRNILRNVSDVYFFILNFSIFYRRTVGKYLHAARPETNSSVTALDTIPVRWPMWSMHHTLLPHQMLWGYLSSTNIGYTRILHENTINQVRNTLVNTIAIDVETIVCLVVNLMIRMES